MCIRDRGVARPLPGRAPVSDPPLLGLPKREGPGSGGRPGGGRPPLAPASRPVEGRPFPPMDGTRVLPPVDERDAPLPRKGLHQARGRDEERGSIDDWVSVQARLTARQSFDPPPSATVETSSPAVMDAAVQVRPLDFSTASVSTSTLGLRTECCILSSFGTWGVTRRLLRPFRGTRPKWMKIRMRTSL